MGKKSRRVRKGQPRAAPVNEGRTQEECLTRKREAIQHLKVYLPGNDLAALNTRGELPFSIEIWANASEVQKIYRRAIECYEERTGFWASMDVKVWEARSPYGNGCDGKDIDEYICAVVGNQFFHMTHYFLSGKTSKTFNGRFLAMDERAIRRWPRVKPHWRRFRRRICTRCPKFALLSEPRFLVCSGCGVAYYCSESCQIADWPAHQGECRWAHRNHGGGASGQLVADGPMVVFVRLPVTFPKTPSLPPRALHNSNVC